ncbi:Peptidase family C25 [Beggiatoa alba B18LD]|uniref:Peptidase family C25 n=1 Tax=Beggiatoa alba B18LD TaxID=395493 RepID=I3CGG4_9GAMM|nr:C25 family cysteine peptidase [Beggiatoa alba]EIJ42707.1 Peptidase family C25 [Beggiatoa alba B18LD]
MNTIRFFISLWLLSFQSLAFATTEIQLLESNSQFATLQLISDGLQLIPTTDEIGETQYQVQLAGASYRPDAPLPLRGTLLATPEGATPRIEILDSVVQTMPARLAITDTNGLPQTPVKFGITGKIREQSITQVIFNPVLYDANAQQITFYQQLTVKVWFNAPTTRNLSSTETEAQPVFNQVLQQTLLNYSPVTVSANKTRALTTSTTCPAGNIRLQLMLEKDGIYFLTKQDFLKIGLDISQFDPRWIEMSLQGQAIPLYVLGEEDGVFNDSDAIFFYAQAMTGEYTRTNVYDLTLKFDGTTRMSLADGTPHADLTPLTQFRASKRVEEDKEYWGAVPTEDSNGWFWARLIAGGSQAMPVTLSNLIKEATETANLRVYLQGRAGDVYYTPDHHTLVFLNQDNIQDAYWDEQETFVHQIEVTQDKLIQGRNTITLSSLGKTGASVDELYVDALEVDYTASYTAENNQLTFTTAETGQINIQLNGFTSDFIVLVDITDPDNVKPYINTQITRQTNGTYSLLFGDTLSTAKKWLALGLDVALLHQPTAMHLEIPNDPPLKSPCQQADYLVIYHESFDVSRLVNHLKTQGHQVLSTTTQDIYDDFNNGVMNPQAIKDFISYAYQHYQSPRPAYVLFIGDANQDYLNRLAGGINYVPTYILKTPRLGDTASDNWFVSVSGDDQLPDLIAGRIPVRTQAQVEAVTDKIIAYTQPSTTTDNWQKNVLFVADNETEFEAVSNYLITYRIPNQIAHSVYLNAYNDSGSLAKADIIKYLNEGALVTSYNGHGGVENWAGEFMFESSDVASLTNQDRLTFAVILSCINGRFANYRATENPLAEALLNTANKGAIAVLAPTGLGASIEHAAMSEELFKNLFVNQQTELGALVTSAKIEAVTTYGVSIDNLEIYTLFGEPSLHIQLP